MTKKELATFEAALTQSALRSTCEQVPDVAIPQSYADLVKGWLPIASSSTSARVEPACSSSVYHATGRTDKTTAQGPRRLFSSRLAALRQLRYEAEQEAASRLRGIDRMIVKEIETPTPLP
jgi:hypothetical protein